MPVPIDPYARGATPPGGARERLKEALAFVAGVCEAEALRLHEQGLSPRLREAVGGHLEGAARRARRALALLGDEGGPTPGCTEDLLSLTDAFEGPGRERRDELA
jgi:hypothetical protein